MKRFFLFVATLLCVAGIQAKTIYLNTGGSDLWETDGANRFAVWHWQGSGEGQWTSWMTRVEGSIWRVDVADSSDKVIFCRFNNAASNPAWDADMWNQTEDLTPGDKNCFKITGWGPEGGKSVGEWGTYSEAPVEYHIAGDGFPGLSWEQHTKLENNTISFTGLEPGTYKFKITDGSWNRFWGIDAVSASCSTQGYGSDSDGNVVIKLASKGDITIKVDKGVICVTIVGDTKEAGGTGVPSQCPDVLMQGFFWDSYKVNDADAGTDLYGDTRWKSLYAQAEEIGAYFDLIWLPPSALASGVGYYPRQYSNQNSDWGSRAELEKLIASFHNSGTKVVADIVLDHFQSLNGWCDYATMDFGKYGKFTPDFSWICKNDELNTTQDPDEKKQMGECYGKATGPEDEGDNNSGARDLAHRNPEVQKFSKAYLQWMLDEMQYDGFRWDEAKGFDPEHIGDYNAEAEPYISFVERWSGTDDIIWTIERTGRRTMALDFQTKYSAFDGIAGFNYEACKGSGLLGAGYAKYAVTFIDSHDWFMRNDQEFAGKGNSMKPEIKDRLLQANAFLLSMPGVPCVFYPHWAKYKEFIKPMIDARHLAGVHSESEVKDEFAEHDGYQCTVVGKNGWLILCLGNKAGNSFDGFKKIASGNGYAIWVNNTGDMAPGIMATPSTAFEDKENGIKVTIEAVGGSGNAKIYYTTDGTNPTTSSAQYTAPLTFKETTTLKIIGVCGSAQSKVHTYTYTYREPLPRGIRVRFAKPEEWAKAYVYAWIPGEDGQGNPTSENIMGAYPGQRIYQDAEGWYAYEFAPEFKTIHFCINSGDDCGGVNVRSNDLEADYDVCYGWNEGKALEEHEEKLLDCETLLNPEFDMVIAPESGFFSDKTEGVDVVIRAIGAENAIIYYTLDGSEPSSESANEMGEVKLKVTQTTTVKAFAIRGQERTLTYTNTYTYKEPQSGPLTVRFQKPEDWEDLYLYAFTRVKVGSQYKDTPYALDGKNSKWPGMHWTERDDNWYIHTMKPDIKEIYVIFTEGDKKPQTQDIFLNENTCYLWYKNCYKAVVDANCNGIWDEAIDEVEPEELHFDPAQPIYNILGQRVGASYIGIVIQNGHKYLIVK